MNVPARALALRLRLGATCFLVAAVLYAPLVWWGIPPQAIRGRTHPWGGDELADSVLSQLNAALFHVGRDNPQYPLFGYVVQALPVAPYAAMAGRVWEPHTADRSRVLRVEEMLARFTNVLLGAGTVIVAWRTSAVLWGEAEAWMAGLLVMLMPPMFYYARTSNVDLPALFFTSLALWQYAAAAVTRELTTRRAIAIGAFAALGVATKDPSFGALLPAALVLVGMFWRPAWRQVMIAGATALAVYVVASGLVVNWPRYAAHLEFIRHGSRRHFQFFYGSTRPYHLVLADTGRLLLQSLSVPVVFLSVAGLWLARRSRVTWFWLLPAIGTVVFTILPVRYVQYRFVMIPAYVLVIPAAYALGQLGRARPRLGRAALILTCVWLGVRDADFSWQMWNDSRYAVRAWFLEHAAPGDRVGFYGTEPAKLPFLDESLTIVSAPLQLPAVHPPEFLIVEPWQSYEAVHDYSLPEETYSALVSGRTGYRLMLTAKTRGLFPTRPGSFVNPEIKVFVREDRAAGM